MVYDPLQNLTWLTDMRYSQTTGYDADGAMDWHDALACPPAAVT